MKLRCETQVDAPEETVMADQDCGGTHRGPYWQWQRHHPGLSNFQQHALTVSPNTCKLHVSHDWTVLIRSNLILQERVNMDISGTSIAQTVRQSTCAKYSIIGQCKQHVTLQHGLFGNWTWHVAKLVQETSNITKDINRCKILSTQAARLHHPLPPFGISGGSVCVLTAYLNVKGNWV